MEPPRAAVMSKQSESTLQHKKLGDSDLLISEITLGTVNAPSSLPLMTWGNQNTEKEAHEQLSYGFDQGINILDTAEALCGQLVHVFLYMPAKIEGFNAIEDWHPSKTQCTASKELEAIPNPAVIHHHILEED
eukprot:Gb_14958 [translate_table: standard]